MAVVEKILKKQCPNCGNINEFTGQTEEDSQEPGSARVTCKSCNWKWKISSPGLQSLESTTGR